MIAKRCRPERTSLDAVVTNADGSVDLFFGPAAPAGKPRENWIRTPPEKGWFPYFRLYGPTERYFDRTWRLPDFAETTWRGAEAAAEDPSEARGVALRKSSWKQR